MSRQARRPRIHICTSVGFRGKEDEDQLTLIEGAGDPSIYAVNPSIVSSVRCEIFLMNNTGRAPRPVDAPATEPAKAPS